MKFTLSWLKDHLDTDASLETIEKTLSSIGLEVEGIEDPSDALGAFTIARIVEAKQHPDADRLRVCQVEIKPGEPTVEVVCGAPNAKPGLIGVFGPIGSYIPGTGITLEKRPVRGIDSNGMMLSERELELSEDHDGIIITRKRDQAVVMLSLEDYESLRETAYLLRSPANARRLSEGIEELERGEGVTKELADLL